MMTRALIATIATVAMIAAGCSSVKSHSAQCRADTDQIIKSFTSLAMQQGMTITARDNEGGFAAAETSVESFLGSNQKHTWQIHVSGGGGVTSTVSVHATAKTVSWSTSAFGGTVGSADVYPDDDYPEANAWYWGVRRGLEKTCGVSLTVTKVGK